MRRLLAGSVILLSACGTGSVHAGAAPLGTMTVSEADTGRAVTLSAGQLLRVQLRSGTWDPPQSSLAAVVAPRSSTGGYPSSRPVDASFAAVAAGRADVSAQSDADCFHARPRCLMAVRQWQLHILVR